jgi:uncharacterized protein (TIGR04222 family)
VKRLLAVVGLAFAVLLVPARAAFAAESIQDYRVDLTVDPDGTLEVHEQITYDFGSEPHHGIFRDVPTTLRYDDRYDRVFPLDVAGVQVGEQLGATWDMHDVPWTVDDVSGGITEIKIGDPDATVSGRHRYDITYSVEGALNAFDDHDELYWNAIGVDWPVLIDRTVVTVHSPAAVTQVACFRGEVGSALACDRSRVSGATATFAQSSLFPFEGVTVVVASPKGVVTPTPRPILRERLTLFTAFRATGARGGVAGALAVLGLGGVGWSMWKVGRDRRFRGSAIDQTMGGTAGDEPVPIGDADTSAPVEFAPPEDLRPGQIGTLLEEAVNTLDVTATIVDLAVRGYLKIQELPKEGWFGKPDWRLVRLDKPDDDLLAYERSLLAGLFAAGSEVELSSLRTTFVERLHKVEKDLMDDIVAKGWFRQNPDTVRARWYLIALGATVLAIAATWILAVAWRLGLIGLPLVATAGALWFAARRMPARTAKGTAVLRRVRGFRTVIDKAETNIARWAEQENVFTKYLPFAIVFGLTEKWAKAFEQLGEARPDTTTWYESSRPFVMMQFAHAIDGFTVATAGTIASTPAGSGSSGFSSGGGFSGGGGGGGGGGSW